MSTYSGFPSFVFGARHFEEFALVAPHMPEALRTVWTDGLRHLADRYWAEGLVSTRNQSAHFIKVFQQLADGSGDPVDAAIARAYAHRFIRGMAGAGYPPEAGGVPGTYSGISHFYMGIYYRLTGDPAMRDALARSYRFYNHASAPEPDGQAYTGFNYSSRVAIGISCRAIPGCPRLCRR